MTLTNVKMINKIYLWTDNQTLNALNETVKKVIKVRHYKTSVSNNFTIN